MGVSAQVRVAHPAVLQIGIVDAEGTPAGNEVAVRVASGVRSVHVTIPRLRAAGARVYRLRARLGTAAAFSQPFRLR